MKLKLKNFRCYTEKEFDFGAEGLLLLSGGSGAGKSTILMAINFVLFDTGTKLISFGKTSCEVQMEFEDLVITRTKRPNRLVVKRTNDDLEFEDEAGQSIINERFGQAFDVTSYVQQNAVNSFILMSPLEKLAFLEKFAFNGIDLSKIKGRCQSIIKKYNEELIGITSNLEMASKHFQTLTKPDKVAFPIKTDDKDRTIQNEKTKLETSVTKIEEYGKHIHTKNIELTATKILQVKLDHLTNASKENKDKLALLTLDIQTTPFDGDEKLEKNQEILSAILSRKELVMLQNRYEEDLKWLNDMRQTEEDQYRKEIKEIEAEFWQKCKPSEINKLIADAEELYKDCCRLKELETNLEKYRVDEDKLTRQKSDLEKHKQKLAENKDALMTLVLQQELYYCPSCQSCLRLQDGKLCLYEEDVIQNNRLQLEELKKEISQLTKTINRLEYTIPEEQNKLDRYNELLTQINDIKKQYEGELPSVAEAESDYIEQKEYKRSQLELEKKKKKLEHNIKEGIYSTNYQKWAEDLLKLAENIKTLEQKGKAPKHINEEELRQTIETQKRNKDKLASLEKQVKSLERTIATSEAELQSLHTEHVGQFKTIHNIADIEQDIHKYEQLLQKYKEKQQKHRKNLDQIEKYQKYKLEHTQYTEWQRKVSTLTEQEENCRRKYAAVTTFKEKILEAEAICIHNIISSINVHAQEYLDLFFPVDPIVVRLLPFKTTKKKTTKPQVNLEIDYKGMEADISTLSGGELSRVVLAFTLALAEIFNSPLILLDECTASLDEDLTSTVIEGIQKNFANKMVIVIAHQVVSGVFDRQIKL